MAFKCDDGKITAYLSAAFGSCSPLWFNGRGRTLPSAGDRGEVKVDKQYVRRTTHDARRVLVKYIYRLESRDPPVTIRIVISAIITKPSETERKKKTTAKHSFDFMILDATETSSKNAEK